MNLPHPKQTAEARVLVVEDEARMRDLLARALTGWGFETDAAKTAEEAIRLNEQKPYDITILDLNLPGMNGMEALARMREKSPHLQAIVLTGFASLDAARQAVHLDVVEFLTKPSHLGEVEKALDRALRRLAPNPPAILDTPDLGSAAEEMALGSMTLDEVERQHILAALRRNEGNRTITARQLGISRRTLYYKLEEYQKQGFAVD